MAGEKNTNALGGAVRAVLMAVIGALLTAVVLLYTGSIGNVQVAASEMRNELKQKADKDVVNKDIARVENDVKSLRTEISSLRKEQSDGFIRIEGLLYQHSQDTKGRH